MDDTQQVAANDVADRVRAVRLFSGFLSTALGVEPDQNYASEDAYIGNPMGLHAVATPYRGTAVQGRTDAFGNPVFSNGQGGAGFAITPGLLLLGAGLWWLMKKA